MPRASEQDHQDAVQAASEYLDRARRRLLYNEEKRRVKDQTEFVKRSVGICFMKFNPKTGIFGLRTTIGPETNAVIVGVFSDPQGKAPTLFLGHISSHRPHDFLNQFKRNFANGGRPTKIFYEIVPGIETDKESFQRIENRARALFTENGIQYDKIPPEFQRAIKSANKDEFRPLAFLMEKNEEEKPGEYPFRVALLLPGF